MWQSVLLHEFPDRNIRSLQGLPGSLSPGSLALNPAEGAVLIAPGRSLHYLLDAPLREVIGVSCRLRIRHPGPEFSSMRIIRLGDAFDLRLEPLTTFQALVRVRVQGTRHYLGQLPNPSARFTELGFDWHTKGQAYLRVDGRLVGYHDALSRGARLTIEDVAFGFPESVPTAADPPYQLGRFFVRALSRRALWTRRHATAVRRP
jgi:hypothetical protein